jgi:XTP/dITP diphosphohydrolase
LLPRPVEVPDVVEDGDTLVDNARLKARALCDATGMAAVADDTGLEVDALGGAPGVHSARYAGETATYADNNEKLLRELAARPDAVRTARFRSVAFVAFPDGSELVAEGIVDGVIAGTPRARERLRPDPVFVPDDGDGRAFAEMDDDEKNVISHRGRAFRALAMLLAARPCYSPASISMSNSIASDGLGEQVALPEVAAEVACRMSRCCSLSTLRRRCGCRGSARGRWWRARWPCRCHRCPTRR